MTDVDGDHAYATWQNTGNTVRGPGTWEWTGGISKGGGGDRREARALLGVLPRNRPPAPRAAIAAAPRKGSPLLLRATKLAY
jgi:hypothetical protein